MTSIFLISMLVESILATIAVFVKPLAKFANHITIISSLLIGLTFIAFVVSL